MQNGYIAEDVYKEEIKKSLLFESGI